MASLNQGKASCPYNIICFKTSGKGRLVRYIIIARNLFKTSIYALEVMLSNFKKTLSHKIFVCWPYSLKALRPTIRPTSYRRMGTVLFHNAGCAFELIATNLQMPAGINLKNISKPKMNPHKRKCTKQLMNTLSRVNIYRDYQVTVAIYMQLSS